MRFFLFTQLIPVFGNLFCHPILWESYSGYGSPTRLLHLWDCCHARGLPWLFFQGTFVQVTSFPLLTKGSLGDTLSLGFPFLLSWALYASWSSLMDIVWIIYGLCITSPDAQETGSTMVMWQLPDLEGLPFELLLSHETFYSFTHLNSWVVCITLVHAQVLH